MSKAKKCGACRGRGQVPEPDYKGRDPAYVACRACDGSGQRDHPNPIDVVQPSPKSVRIELHEEAARLLRKLLMGIAQSSENDRVNELCQGVISQIEDEIR